MNKLFSFLTSICIGFLILPVLAVGLYPLMYLLSDSPISIVAGKGEVGENLLWLTAFYLHILFGGMALLLGWTQFIRTWRNRNLSLHRNLGKLYIISILVFSAPAGLYLAFYAFGGIMNKLGFALLAVCWFGSTVLAYLAVKRKQLQLHQQWMIRSFALSLAAVTLRIYMPLMQAGFHWSFDFSYSLVAWLCWVPNLIIAEWIIFKGKLT